MHTNKTYIVTGAASGIGAETTRHLTHALIHKMADAASIVNIASLAGAGWQKSLEQVRAALEQDFTSDSLVAHGVD